MHACNLLMAVMCNSRVCHYPPRSFLFLYLSELGADGTLMGLCLSANCAAEVPSWGPLTCCQRRVAAPGVLHLAPLPSTLGQVPVFFFSGQIIRRLGVNAAFRLAMGAYVLRMGCYALLHLAPTLYLVLAAELLQARRLGAKGA